MNCAIRLRWMLRGYRPTSSTRR